MSKKRDLPCSSARRSLSVCVSWRGQRGTTSNDVALCFDDAEQVFDFMRADGSIMHVCLLCVLHRVLLPARRAPFHCVCLPSPVAHGAVSSLVVSICRSCSLSNYFLSCLSPGFPLQSMSKKEKDIGFYLLLTVEDLGLVTTYCGDLNDAVHTSRSILCNINGAKMNVLLKYDSF